VVALMPGQKQVLTMVGLVYAFIHTRIQFLLTALRLRSSIVYKMKSAYTIHGGVQEAEIRGWRKALALGAAGLAGLAPMKAHAGGWEPPGQAQAASIQTQIQALQKKIDAKFGQIDDRTKANKNFQASLKNLGSAWNDAQDPSEKLEALQNIWTYIDYWSSRSDVLQAPIDAAQQAGYKDGKTYDGLPDFNPDTIQQTAKIQASFNGYYDESPNRTAYIQGWIKGAQDQQKTASSAATAPAEQRTYNVKSGAIVASQREDLLKLMQLNAHGNKAAVHKLYRQLLDNRVWEIKTARQHEFVDGSTATKPDANGIVKITSPGEREFYIAQDDLIPSSSP
jgi:hypothetical protein